MPGSSCRPGTPSRRTLIEAVGGGLALASVAARPAAATARQPYLAFVGSRTTRERNARGEGISVFQVEPHEGRWTHLQTVGGLENPSFLALDRTAQCLYTVHGDREAVSALRISPDGRLEVIDHRSTRGLNPVHLTFDPTNRWLVVTNHLASSLAVLPRRDDGTLGEVVSTFALEGQPGPRTQDQPFSKPHQALFDPSGRVLAVPDKGLDRTFLLALDRVSGSLAQAGPPLVGRPACGPRHLAFHPTRPLAFVLNELDSTITAARFDTARPVLEPFQIIPSLPDSFLGVNHAAEIAVSPDGRRLYASNRGHDSLGVFWIGSEGRLEPQGWSSTRGRTPRHFAISPDGRFLFAANETSHSIARFRIETGTGNLTAVGDLVQTGSPVCIVFRPRLAGAPLAR